MEEATLRNTAKKTIEDLERDLGLTEEGRWPKFWRVPLGILLHGPSRKGFLGDLKARFQRAALRVFFSAFIREALEEFKGKLDAVVLEVSIEDKWGLSISDVVQTLIRGSPVGPEESDALERLERAFRDGPLGQRLREGLVKELLWDGDNGDGELSQERMLAVLESGSPVGHGESSFLAAVRRLGYSR